MTMQMKFKMDMERLDGIKTNAKEKLFKRLEDENKTEIRNGNIVLKGDYYKRQVRIALRNCEIIKADDIEEYIALEGYNALGKMITSMSQEEVLKIMKDSLLRGRGGAGFPAGIKWETAYGHEADQKYIICNADEGDPGAFMDRSILENDPHSVLEGMAIAGYATGADQGFIYVRAEYPTAVESLKLAIKQAKAYGLLGENILGTDFSFDVELRLGSGAFVCGEGTALMESIEGRRGMPREKIYRTAHKGLWQKPTIINNVETLANVPIIFQKGADWFRNIGTEDSPGTKVFALVGKVKDAGLVEVPMGMSIKEIVYDIGGGLEENRELQAVQTGGPSGGCIPEQLIDTPVDFESLAEIGSIMGSGGMVVMDDTDCIVDIAKFFLDFTVEESCGKCVPCREGTKIMRNILNKITDGRGTIEDLDLLEELSDMITNTALCGLGQTAANPVVSSLNYFREEYLAHVVDKKCTSKVCRDLISVVIDPELCKGCGKCKKVCPVDAIDGEIKGIYEIDQDECIKCDSCIVACPFLAIEEV